MYGGSAEEVRLHVTGLSARPTTAPPLGASADNAVSVPPLQVADRLSMEYVNTGSDIPTVGYTDCGMARTTLRAKGQLTLPEEIRTAARLTEGDLLDAEITDEGILLRPQKVIDATQAWFWTPEWQAGERDADAQEAAGLGETFESGEAFLDAMRARAKPPTRRRKR